MAKGGEDLDKQDNLVSGIETKPKSGGLGLVHIIGIVFGSLLFLVVAVRFLILPYVIESLKPNEEASKKKEEISKPKGPFDGVEKELIKFIETGRITTNPLNSDQFVVVNLGLKFFARDKKVLREIFGQAAEGEVSLPPELMAKIRGKINQTLGSMTVTDLNQNRTRLPYIFLDSLKPVFSEGKLVLGEVIMNEFIIQ